MEDLQLHQRNEYGIDDFIEARSLEAESLMELGKISDAIVKYE
jgi:hypothetical protein